MTLQEMKIQQQPKKIHQQLLNQIIPQISISTFTSTSQPQTKGKERKYTTCFS